MPSFKALVTGLQPNRSVIIRPTVMKRISEKATLIKENIKEAMAKVEHVATTTDSGLLTDDRFLVLPRTGLMKKHWNERVPL